MLSAREAGDEPTVVAVAGRQGRGWKSRQPRGGRGRRDIGAGGGEPGEAPVLAPTEGNKERTRFLAPVAGRQRRGWEFVETNDVSCLFSPTVRRNGKGRRRTSGTV
jgi:hypothetical protein